MTTSNMPIPDKETVEAAKKAIDKIQVRGGVLEVDHDRGTIIFKTCDNQMLLRITHLKNPIPRNGFIDIVALDALTSYLET